MDRIQARLAGAGIPANGAAAAGAGLGGSIGDRIPGTGAAALEGVVQTKPVADLVSSGVAKVVVGRRTTGHRRAQDGAAVADLGGGAGAAAAGLGEVAVAEVVAHLREEVDVERAVAALAEGALHGHLVALGVVGPVGVDGVCGALEGELEAVGGVGLVKGGELGVED